MIEFVSTFKSLRHDFSGVSGQVSAWQSVTLLPIRCESEQVGVEEPVSPVSQSSSGGPMNMPPFPEMS